MNKVRFWNHCSEVKVFKHTLLMVRNSRLSSSAGSMTRVTDCVLRRAFQYSYSSCVHRPNNHGVQGQATGGSRVTHTMT